MNIFWDGPLPKPSERTVVDMQNVLSDTGITADNKTLYFMYRSLSKSGEDLRWLSENKLRYDITVIPPCILGREFVKTKGHYHPEGPGGYGYPELYQVLSGEAHFILQKKDLSDICVILAKEGDVVLIPPGFGHVTINPSDKTLVMANIVSDDFESEYDDYTRMQGAAYYEFSDGSFVKNPKYDHIPDIRMKAPDEIPQMGLYHKKPIYSLIGDDGLLDFLNNPSVIEEIIPEFL
ncbi:MAG: glucose-6-phosphate isomerase [Methanomicrobiaceae archaeon]|nr:glucose-6-phosphate isomerase [Methanomicrobiaceae archaeon]